MSQSKNTRWPLGLKLGVLAIILFFLYIFNISFISPLLVGAIIAVLTYPVYSWVHHYLSARFKKDLKGPSALLTIIFFSVVIVAVGNLFVRQLVAEIPNFSESVLGVIQGVPENQAVLNLASSFGYDKGDVEFWVSKAESEISRYTDFNNDDVNQAFLDGQLFNQILNFGRQTFSVAFNFLVYVVIMVLTWFNALIHGRDWLDNLYEILPLTDEETDSIQKDLRDGIRNVVYASLLSGFIHAFVSFLLMVIFDIPNKFILTSLIFIIGWLPLSPSELAYAFVLVPIFFEYPLIALILAVLAEFIILWVNYVLTPRVIASGQEANPLLILTSILSGISIFGIMGFIIAPVIMIFVQTLYRILMRRLRTEAEES